jgi:hypothetical protein
MRYNGEADDDSWYYAEMQTLDEKLEELQQNAIRMNIKPVTGVLRLMKYSHLHVTLKRILIATT